MTAEEGHQGGEIGFAGLNGMVSDVDATIAGAAQSTKTDLSDSSLHSPGHNSGEAHDEPPGRANSLRPQEADQSAAVGKWLFGVAAVAVVGVLASQWNNNSSEASRAAGSSVSSASPSSEWQAVEAQPEQTRLVEERPPVGTANVLGRAQIRYCLAEKIRLDAADPLVDTSVALDVEQFNTSVEDYNSRCEKFRYRRGVLEGARQDVDAYRAQLEEDGRARFSATKSVSPSASEPSSAMEELLQDRDGNSNAVSTGAPADLDDKARSPRPSQTGGVTSTDSGPPRMASLPPATHELDRKANDENFNTCISGNYPSLCKHNLLTREEYAQVQAAERRANYQTCISGNYPSLCKHSLLSNGEAPEVEAAERRANFHTCISGNYPSLCKHSLLTSAEAAQVELAELRANFQTCISGNYPSLCKHSLLTSVEAAQVNAAERRANFKICISGNYPTLCKRSLLSQEDSVAVAEAERRAGSR